MHVATEESTPCLFGIGLFSHLKKNAPNCPLLKACIYLFKSLTRNIIYIVCVIYVLLSLKIWRPRWHFTWYPHKSMFWYLSKHCFCWYKLLFSGRWCQVLCIKSDKMEYKVIRLLGRSMSHASIARSYFWHWKRTQLWLPKGIE